MALVFAVHPLLLSTAPAADVLLEKRGHVALSTDDGLDHQILQDLGQWSWTIFLLVYLQQ